MINYFADRVEELKELNYTYKHRRSHLAIVYGRRRIADRKNIMV